VYPSPSTSNRTIAKLRSDKPRAAGGEPAWTGEHFFRYIGYALPPFNQARQMKVIEGPIAAGNRLVSGSGPVSSRCTVPGSIRSRRGASDPGRFGKCDGNRRGPSAALPQKFRKARSENQSKGNPRSEFRPGKGCRDTCRWKRRKEKWLLARGAAERPQQLGAAEIRTPHHAHIAITPGAGGHPLDHFRQVLLLLRPAEIPGSFRVIGSPHVHDDMGHIPGDQNSVSPASFWPIGTRFAAVAAYRATRKLRLGNFSPAAQGRKISRASLTPSRMGHPKVLLGKNGIGNRRGLPESAGFHQTGTEARPRGLRFEYFRD